MVSAISTLEMNRQEWLHARKRGIGGSDASVILGFNKWKSPFQLYLEKTGEFTEEIDNEFIYWGNLLEDIVAKEFESRTGKKVRRRNQMFVHPEHDFMIANIDRDVVGERALLECKTTNAFNSNAWDGDEIPAEYICQVQHYMAVLGYEKAYIAVLIGGNKFVWKEVERDDEFIDIMIQREKEFWENHVLAGVPPAIDGSPSATELLNKLYPTDNGETVMLDSETEQLIEAIESLKAEKKQIEEQLKAYENQLKMTLEDASVGVTNRFKITYKAVTQNRIDSKRLKEEHPEIYEKYLKSSISRRLTIKEVI
ncbi:YqaJ viral recombinase family nuclease [Ureibacillus thermosphaericus]|uniref:Putative phage-type endonuclease n=1 Tax=Ureibacillus thermosphaericus TaxID=51173 RepID=A0A840PQM0_URETH|nr:YqaJ viral recombinase family protein [Ureibacillus thermosphaericus]MBB5148210.1 putative phage-type endonuclease [Ureibacillus thermosphaericus]NKZ31118.1 hypothetical protein [Ureibacillus thermosphaericus]